MQPSRLVSASFLLTVCVGTGVGWSAEKASADALTVETGSLALEFSARDNAFTAIARGSGLRFVERGVLTGTCVAAESEGAAHPVWGRGRALKVQFSSGAVSYLRLFPELPFVVLESTWANDSNESVTINKVRPVSITLGSRKAANELRVLGTAGLTAVGRDSHPGSYSFLAVADPETRAGVVVGWLTHERGSGVVFSDTRDGKAVIDAQLDYGRLLIRPGQKVRSEMLLIGYFDDARLGLEAYADAIARYYRIKLPPQPTVYCTWYHAGASNEQDLVKNARFAAEHLVPFGFSVIQIDDGWQAGEKKNGPRRDFTTPRADGPYRSGMKQTADRIRALGLTPGIWFMPFAGTWNDPFFGDRQELFATKDGKPFEVNWGGTCFDMTNPKTREYVRSVASRIARDWGYRYFKLDGLWTGMAAEIRYINTGYKDDQLGETTLYDPGKTHVEAYRDGLQLVREAAGSEVFLLGCNVAQNMRTLGASFGLLDAMRIGPDNGRKWPQICRGPFSGSSLYFLHGRVWYNDPDPIYVGDKVPLDHARALTSWVTLTGQLNASSEDYAALSPKRLHLLQRSMPAHGLRARPVDLFEQRIPRAWLLTDDRRTPRRDIVGLFNWEEKEQAHVCYPADKIGLPPAESYVGFDFWADAFAGPFGRQLESDLPPASCRILAVRPVSSQPQVISTSRHLTQGVVDILEEKWDPGARTLSGVSRVVANDPYELRMVAMGPPRASQAIEAVVSQADAQAGVTIRIVRQEDWKIRVRIDSPKSREVHWSVAFARLSGGSGKTPGETGPERAGVPVGDILMKRRPLSFSERLPQSKDITKVTIGAGMNIKQGGDMTEAKFRRLIDSASAIAPEDETIFAWHYAPWYSLSFETRDGVYALSLFLGGRGFLQFPGRDVVAIGFKQPE